MRDRLQRYLDRIYSDDPDNIKGKSSEKPQRSGMKKGDKIFILSIVGVLLVGVLAIGISVAPLMSSLDDTAPDQGDAGTMSRSNPSAPDPLRGDFSRGPSNPMSEHDQSSMRGNISMCDGSDALLPRGWRSRDIEGGVSYNLDMVINTLRDERSTRDEAISVLARGLATTLLNNMSHETIPSTEELGDMQYSGSESRGGLYLTPMNKGNWRRVMDPVESTRDQLDELKDQGISEYREGITPGKESSASFVNLASIVLSSVSGDSMRGVGCIPRIDQNSGDPYLVAKSWEGTPASSQSGDPFLGPTLSGSREEGPASFSGLEFVRYSYFQAYGEEIPSDRSKIMNRPKVDPDKIGAIAVVMENESPSLLGISNGDGNVILANESTGVIIEVPITQLGDEVEYR